VTEPIYRTILVPTDLSEPSIHAVRHAAKLAAATGARLVLTYVMDAGIPAMILAHSAQTEQELLDRHREHAEQSLDNLAQAHLAGVAAEYVVRKGVAHQQIVALAEEIDADLIVMGMQGHGSLLHALGGSTTERVLHHARCPVLVVGMP
jgi:nucleotide-binding universal stress UspA family protein